MLQQNFDTTFREAISISRSRFWGIGILLCFTLGFGYWATTVSLAGAVIASGWVTKEGRTQSIVHERGGVIAKIGVAEGDFVEQGSLLIEIEDADRLSEKEQIETQLAYLSLKEARLVAEENNHSFDQLPLAILASDGVTSKNLERLFFDQQKEFEVRRQMRTQEEAILLEQKRALERRYEGAIPELKSMKAWRDILQKQVEMRTTLLKRGAVSKVALQDTKKDWAEVEVDFQRVKTQVEALPHEIAEIEARFDRIAKGFSEKIARELSELRSEKLTLEKRLRAAEVAVARVELRAPTSGFIDKLHINTIGSAVAAFEPIVEIVPSENPILVEVQINPADIEQVTVGQNARLVLSAYEATDVQPLNAKVKFVSPDRRINPQTQMPYFVARLELAKEQDQDIPEIVPGMPVEAYMETEERTFLQLLIEPVTKSLRRSFRS